MFGALDEIEEHRDTSPKPELSTPLLKLIQQESSSKTSGTRLPRSKKGVLKTLKSGWTKSLEQTGNVHIRSSGVYQLETPSREIFLGALDEIEEHRDQHLSKT